MTTSLLRSVDRTIDRLHPYRRLILLAVQVVLTVAANQAAFWLRFDGMIPDEQRPFDVTLLPLLIVVRLVVFLPLRLDRGIWRYASIWDLQNIIFGATVSSALFWAITHVLLGIRVYPRSVFIMDTVLLVCFLGGVRVLRRAVASSAYGGERRSVLVYGAGDAGEMVVRDMLKGTTSGYEPVGFVDDDARKLGRRIHGVPVLGSRGSLARIIAQKQPQEIVIAIPTADALTRRGIVQALEPFKLRITTVPSLREIFEGRGGPSQIRNLSLEDLLGRDPIGLDPRPLRRLLQGRRVLVTGAGGSIGSELCRQVAAFGPSRLILVDRHENGLFATANDLADRHVAKGVAVVVADVTDEARIDAVLSEHRPEVVFHAAAHKHVPMMESNPCEAIKNNVRGTRLLLGAAERHGVDRFVLISTDKAVNPTNVMGASKRVAELLLQAGAAHSNTSVFAVRFGNVLASNGSVVPRFLEQIRAGGPVTVTHPEMRRYFMLIPEAVELVLHAATQGEDGQIYMLDMGHQVQVLEMARNLIRLSGFIPEQEIPITFTGLRPGEKLEEQLVGDNEVAEPSAVPKIMRLRPRVVPDVATLREQVAQLEATAIAGHVDGVLHGLREIIPEFAPASGTDKEGSVAGLRRGGVAFEPQPDLEEHATRAALAQPCPSCGARDAHRSRAHTLAERVRRFATGHGYSSHPDLRLYRCHTCSWRGWLVPVDPAALGRIARRRVLDWQSLDAMLDPTGAGGSPTLSARPTIEGVEAGVMTTFTE